MAHGDDQGLVLPPKISPKQVVIVPIWQDDNEEEVVEYAEDVREELDDYRVEFDDRDYRTPGYKFNEWEMKGVPLRIEIGPNEVENESLTVVRRDTGEQESIDSEDVEERVEEMLGGIQANMLEEQSSFQRRNVREADTEEEIVEKIREHGGYVKAEWCGDERCETPVKEEVAADIVMVPLEDEKVEGSCAICGEEATETAYFARNY